MLPGFGDPVDDLAEVVAAPTLDELPSQEAPQEALNWLRVVGTEHPSESRHQEAT